MAYDGKVVIGTKVDEKGLNTGLSNVSMALKGFASGVAALGIGAALTKEFTEVVKATQSFEQGIAKASTLFGDVVVDMKNLKAGLRDISASTGADMGELGEAVYNAMSAGIAPSEDMADVLQLVEKSSKLAKGGFTDVDTALSATVKTMNAYGEGIESTDRIMNVLMQTQNLGITTVGELGASLSQVVPTAAAFGVAFEEVGAALSVMTAAGTSTAMATTQLNSLFAELGKSGTMASKNLAEAASNAGLSATSFAELVAAGYDLPQILEMMSKYADKAGLSMLDMFSSIEAGKAALSLSGESAEKFADNLTKMSEGAGLVDEAFKKVVRPTERVKEAITNLRIQLGDKFTGAATNATNDLADFLEKLGGTRTSADDLDSAIETLISTQKAYRDALEASRDSQDELTKAMEATTYAAFVAALGETAKSYEETLKGMKDAQDDLADGITYGLLDQVNGLSASLEKAAGGAENVLNHYKELKRAKELDVSLSEEDVKYLQWYEDRAKLMQEVADKQSFLISEQTKLDAVTLKVAKAVRSESIALEDVYAVSTALGESVELEIIRLGKQDKAIEEAKTAWTSYTDSTEKDLEALANRFRANADAYAEGSEKRIYWMTLLELAEEKLKSITAEAMAVEAKKAETERQAVEASEQYTEAQNKLRASIDEVVMSAAYMQAANDALGEDLYTQKDIVDTLKDGYVALIQSGIDPADAYMQTLLDTIKEMNIELGKTTEEHVRFSGAIKDVIDSQTRMERTNSNLGVAFYSLDEQLEFLETSYQSLLESGIEPTAEGMDIISEKIEDLKEKSLNGTISSWTEAMSSFGGVMSDTFEAIAEGEDAWAVFARSGLTAIAKVVEALGHELAAEAAKAFAVKDFATGSAATAKSLAAYAAAGLIKGWAGAFATGGVVRGPYTGGDNLTASVKAGETILNHAQTQNVARLLDALEKSAGKGGGLVIAFNGAVYGDEERIATTVYDKIRSLQGEGRLGKW